MSLLEIVECQQGSDQWLAARVGIVTASEMHCVLAKGEGKTRRAYMLRLAGERLTGEPAEMYQNHHMQRGRDQEDEARRLYAFTHDVEPISVGFVRNGDVGCSPDSFLGDNAILEIKSRAAHLQVELLLLDRAPPEHKAQCQGSLWVTEREFVDLVCYCPSLPMFVARLHRDEAYIKTLADEVERFNDELAAIVERVRHYGMPLTDKLQQSLARMG